VVVYLAKKNVHSLFMLFRQIRHLLKHYTHFSRISSRKCSVSAV